MGDHRPGRVAATRQTVHEGGSVPGRAPATTEEERSPLCDKNNSFSCIWDFLHALIGQCKKMRSWFSTKERWGVENKLFP